MFNYVKSVTCVFSLLPKSPNLSLFGKLAALGAVFLWLDLKVRLRFVLSAFKSQVQFSQAYELNQFLGFWFLFTNLSRVKLPYS